MRGVDAARVDDGDGIARDGAATIARARDATRDADAGAAKL